jgi:hypothetical protein
MDLVELLENRKLKVEELSNIVSTGKEEQRKLEEIEENNIEQLKVEISNIDTQIEEMNKRTEINNKTKNKENRNMENFSDLIVRNGERVENLNVRALVLASGIDNVTVAGNTSVVGYEPFYKQMGVTVYPNLVGSLKLPYQSAIVAGKKGEGARQDNVSTPLTVLLQPSRYTVTETVGKELLAVGNEQALQSFLFEMVKGVDRAITKDIFDVLIAGASAQAGLVGYTTANMDTLVANVDGDTTILMPRAEFYKAKNVKIDAGSGIFLANKTSQFAGNMWDGTPLFYSQLFANATIVAADLKHVAVGEFGSDVEVIFDTYTKAPEGSVVITVCKLGDVKLVNALAAKKALVA